MESVSLQTSTEYRKTIGENLRRRQRQIGFGARVQTSLIAVRHRCTKNNEGKRARNKKMTSGEPCRRTKLTREADTHRWTRVLRSSCRHPRSATRAEISRSLQSDKTGRSKRGERIREVNEGKEKKESGRPHKQRYVSYSNQGSYNQDQIKSGKISRKKTAVSKMGVVMMKNITKRSQKKENIRRISKKEKEFKQEVGRAADKSAEKISQTHNP